MAEIYQLPSENSGSNAGMGNIPFSIPIGGMGGGLFGGNGFGSPSPSIDYLKKTLDEKDFETVEGENKAE